MHKANGDEFLPFSTFKTTTTKGQQANSLLHPTWYGNQNKQRQMTKKKVPKTRCLINPIRTFLNPDQLIWILSEPIIWTKLRVCGRCGRSFFYFFTGRWRDRSSQTFSVRGDIHSGLSVLEMRSIETLLLDIQSSCLTWNLNARSSNWFLIHLQEEITSQQPPPTTTTR